MTAKEMRQEYVIFYAGRYGVFGLSRRDFLKKTTLRRVASILWHTFYNVCFFAATYFTFIQLVDAKGFWVFVFYVLLFSALLFITIARSLVNIPGIVWMILHFKKRTSKRT